MKKNNLNGLLHANRLLWTGVLLFWSCLIIVFVVISFFERSDGAYRLALTTARDNFSKDRLFRHWIATQGGIYVRPTESVPPNPYLADVSQRDVVTTDGMALTLMNPAYVMRKVSEQDSALGAARGHLTSLRLLNPANKPSQWERRALEGFENGEKEYIEQVELGAVPTLRYMRPLLVEENCLACHAKQGYRVGDIRGGISFSIDMRPYLEALGKVFEEQITTLLLLWLAGVTGIGYAFYRQGRHVRRNVRLEMEKMRQYEAALRTLVGAIENRDRYTAGHSQRVAEYSVMIGKKMGLEGTRLALLKKAAMLHDIGKIATPDSILLKPGSFSSLEFDVMKEHAQSGAAMLKESNLYRELAPIVRSHHERHDGSGYPDGLAGEEIPLLARIMTVADAFDAMTTSRIYKPKKSVEEARMEIARFSGIQFHPEVAEAAVSAFGAVTLDGVSDQSPISALEEERFAYFFKDQLTNLYNVEYLDLFLNHHADEYETIYMIFLHGMQEVNNVHGWKTGDAVIKSFAEDLKEQLKGGYIFRVHGNDFLALAPASATELTLSEFIPSGLEGCRIPVSVKAIEKEGSGIKRLDDILPHFRA